MWKLRAKATFSVVKSSSFVSFICFASFMKHGVRPTFWQALSKTPESHQQMRWNVHSPSSQWMKEWLAGMRPNERPVCGPPCACTEEGMLSSVHQKQPECPVLFHDAYKNSAAVYGETHGWEDWKSAISRTNFLRAKAEEQGAASSLCLMMCFVDHRLWRRETFDP